MSGLETLLLKLGASVVKSTVKIWLGDAKIAADATATAIDVLTDRVPGAIEKRRLRRMFDGMEEVVAKRLEPLIATEFGTLPENEKLAAIEAANDTFSRAALTDDDLFAADLDAGYVYRYLVRTVPGMAREALLSADGTAFYERLMRECSAYLVQITTTLPRFQTGVLTELLRRDTEIINLIHDVLTRMPQRRGLTDFEADYRLQIVTALDRVSFFGATLSDPSRQYPLSVAYISLAVSARSVTTHRIEEILIAYARFPLFSVEFNVCS